MTTYYKQFDRIDLVDSALQNNEIKIKQQKFLY